MEEIKLVKKYRHHSGWLRFYSHFSKCTQTPMKFSIYVPTTTAAQEENLPTLFWLSGLTCNEENFVMKSGFGKKASELKMIVICPDTSPRTTDLPGEHQNYDFGSGAGFYVNATEQPWARHYQMYQYVSHELPKLALDHFPINESQMGISGHSMGGHGALVLGIRNKGLFRSISAFSPIVAPNRAPWGQRAFEGYLGSNREEWKKYDACELIRNGQYEGRLLIHQGEADEFLHSQLKTNLLLQAVNSSPKPVELDLRMVENFDHSYYFVSSFIDDHLEFHFKELTC